MLGCVSVARHNFYLLLFALLVFYLERTAVGGHDLYFQLAVGAIELAVGGMIGQRILIANVGTNVLKVLAILRRKSGKIGAAPGHRGEGAHFIVSLNVI